MTAGLCLRPFHPIQLCLFLQGKFANVYYFQPDYNMSKVLDLMVEHLMLLFPSVLLNEGMTAHCFSLHCNVCKDWTGVSVKEDIDRVVGTL